MESEVWLTVDEFEGFYEVSNLGRIRSLDRADGLGRPRRGKVLNPVRDRKNHFSVYMRGGGKGRHRFVHRLVLTAFVGPCPEGFEGCHNDGDPSNNRLDNLRWDSQSGNVLDTVRHGTHRQTKKQTCAQGHPLKEPNLVPSQLRRGWRSCLACSRAGRRVADMRSRGKETALPFAELADTYYADLARAEREAKPS